MSAHDPRLDQMLGETLRLMAETGVTTGSDPVAIGKFASQFHARMEKVLPALQTAAPTDTQQAIIDTVNSAVKAAFENLLAEREGDLGSQRRKVTVNVAGRKTSVSLPADLANRMETLLGARDVNRMAQEFVDSCPAGVPPSRWVAQRFENHWMMHSLGNALGTNATTH